MSAVATRARRGELAAARPPILRQIAGWLRRSLRPSAPARLVDPAVSLATFLDDGERRDRQLVVLREQAFGPHHPDVATALHILAARYHLVRRYDQAETLYNRALLIRTESLGHDHPATVEVLEDLGDLWRDRGDRYRASCTYDLALAAVADPERRKRKHQDYAARLVRIDPSGTRQDS
jgi:tetratricopeptide (TPR) repeat protein